MSTLEELEREIRDAVGAGEFGRAGELWPVYCLRLQTAITAGEAEAADLRKAEDMVAWARQSARCAQALAAGQLNQLAVQSRYRQQQPRPHLLSFTG